MSHKNTWFSLEAMLYTLYKYPSSQGYLWYNTYFKDWQLAIKKYIEGIPNLYLTDSTDQYENIYPTLISHIQKTEEFLTKKSDSLDLLLKDPDILDHIEVDFNIVEHLYRYRGYIKVFIPGTTLPAYPLGEVWSKPTLPHENAQFLTTQPLRLLHKICEVYQKEFAPFTPPEDNTPDQKILWKLEDNLKNPLRAQKRYRRDTYFPNVK